MKLKIFKKASGGYILKHGGLSRLYGNRKSLYRAIGQLIDAAPTDEESGIVRTSIPAESWNAIFRDEA